MARTAILDPSALFAALSDRTRLRLLNLLRGGERCVCDLVDGVGAPQPTVSRHLALLRRAGLVRTRRDGLWVHYRLAEGAEALLLRLFECLSECSSECPEFPRDEKRVLAARKARGCCD
ncbi:MAG: ArsR/SmtB family transcription factor [Planctomycetota bacterium]